MSNPYRSPEAESALPLPRALYSSRHVAWASFVGAPLAGCLLLAINYRSFGKGGAAIWAIVVGIASTVLLMVLGFLLPDSFPNTVLPAISTFAMYQAAQSLQGRSYEQSLQNGYRKASGWRATGIGVLGLLCTIAGIVGVTLAIQ